MPASRSPPMQRPRKAIGQRVIIVGSMNRASAYRHDQRQENISGKRRRSRRNSIEMFRSGRGIIRPRHHWHFTNAAAKN